MQIHELLIKLKEMHFRFLLRELLKVTVSTVCAGIFYAAWMAVFLLTPDSGSQAIRAIEWMLAPVITAAGFTTGAKVFACLTRERTDRFLRIFIWPLVGCAVGALSVYWFGPMLIVFGMFAPGTVSIILREVVLAAKKEHRPKTEA